MRCYSELVAVDSISFAIQKGEIVGLLGHNGAGKTTIMKMMTGFLEPGAGSITFDGVDMHGPNLSETTLLKQKLGYLAENLPLYPEMTVIDYLDYTAQMHGLSAVDRPSAVNRAVVETDLRDKVFDLIATLSRGYRQRVGVAQAILHAPAYLVLDEPTNGLDPSQTRHMRELIKRLSKTATILLSTHIMQEVNAVCDRVLILREGKLVLDEPLNALKHSSRLLLRTSADLATVDAAVSGIKELYSSVLIDDTSSTKELALPLRAECDTEAVAAEAVKFLVAGDVPVFSLVPEQRDLEALFQDPDKKDVKRKGLAHVE